MNINENVVADFGREWSRFDQSELTEDELRRAFNQYFDIFPWDRLPLDAVGFDLGCGSGRWSKFVARRVGRLHLIDPSEQALNVARTKLADRPNCEFHQAGVDNIPLPDNSCDFGYSLGVLHHIPDTQDGLNKCVAKLKPGAPFLVYLYYRFDNRPPWFRAVWKASDVVRKGISSLPFRAKALVADTIAAGVYWPLSRASRFVPHLPLSQYKHSSFYVMRTDSLDRFGTRLEHRFTRDEIEAMMLAAGLTDIRFSEHGPYWHAVGCKVA